MRRGLRKFAKVVGLGLILLFLVPISGCGDNGESAADAGRDAASDGARTDAGIDPRFEPVVESLKREMLDLGAPGAAVAIIEKGEVTFAAGFGTRNPDKDDPVGPATLFRIGSVNKMLTAAGLLRLVDEGKVDLEKPITDYLPDFAFTQNPAWAPSITVWNLLTHSTGIVDYLEIDAKPEYQDDDGLSAYLDGEFESVGYLMAPAGAMYNYSNPNFMLAGYILEKVSGEPYRQYMKDHVFTPLGMERTCFLPDEVLADGDYAFGLNNLILWGPELPSVMAPDAYDNPWGRPAGYAWSSVLDLAEFVKFLLHGNPSVLSDEQRKAMQEPQISTQEMLDLVSYGFGLSVGRGAFLGPGSEDFYLLKLVSHDGAIPGYSAEIFFVPEFDFGFITLANSDGAYFTDTLVTAVTTLNTMPSRSEPPDLEMDPATFGRYVGKYLDLYNVGEILVSQEGDGLRISMPFCDAQAVPYEPMLEPYSPDNFILNIQGTDILLTFLFDDQGKVAFLRTRAFVATPYEEDAGADASLLEMPAADLDSLRVIPELPSILRLVKPRKDY